MNQHRAALTILFYLVCCGIVYGSLFPFDFVLMPERAVVDRFLASWRTASGRGDTLGNIALFIPYGLLAHVLLSLPGGNYGNTRYFALVWLLVAVGSQLVQFFVPGRDPSVFDLYCNAAGTLLGWLLLRFIPAKTTSGLANVNLAQQVSLVLPLLWLASELIPFVPTIDLQAYKDAIKPLFLYPRWSWYDALLQATSWVVCLSLLSSYAGIRISWQRLLPAMVAVALLKIVIVKNSISVTDVVAMAVAMAAWVLLGRRHLRPRALAYVLLLSLVMSSVFPFIPRLAAATFGWVPFSGFLEGSMLSNATALCQKLFVFGAIAFLTQQEDGGWKKRSLLIALVLAMVEFGQVWWASGTPEITDPVLFLGIAWFYAKIRMQKVTGGILPDTGQSEVSGSVNGVQEQQDTAGNLDQVVAVENAAQLLQQALYDQKSHVRPPEKRAASRKDSRRRLLLVVAAYCATVYLLLRALLALTGVPYNIAELFRFDASGIDLLFFSLTLLSLGWGGAWLGTVFATTTRPLKDIPLALIKLALIIYFFLWMSVTRESIMDISGSSVFVHRVTERGVLGEFGTQVIALLGRSNVHTVTSALEPVLRFGALIWPLLIFCGVCFWVAKPAGKAFDSAAVSAKKYVSSAIVLVIWLYMSKVLAFDWSSTDNLNELIAPDGAWGIGGGGYLYLLLLLFSAMGAFVSWAHFRNIRTLLIAVVMAILSISVSWYLLNHGLGKDIGKYGAHFSGVDFLLGPDRTNLISQSQLVLRWSVLHTIIVMGLAFSASLYYYWAGSKGASVPMLNVPKTGSETALEFRVYKEQRQFLQSLARSTGLSVDKLVLDILAYFDSEISSSPHSRELVQGYVNGGGDRGSVGFAPGVIHVEISAEALELMSVLDPDNAYSASKVFRRLLTIFIAMSEEKVESP